MKKIFKNRIKTLYKRILILYIIIVEGHKVLSPSFYKMMQQLAHHFPPYHILFRKQLTWLIAF